MSKIYNVPRDSTLQEKNQLDRQRNDLLAAIAAGKAAPEFVDATFAGLLDDHNTSEVFRRWWPISAGGPEMTKYKRLERWFTMLGDGLDRCLTVRFYSPAVSSDDNGVGIDWLAGKQAAPLATDTVDPADDWAEECRETWYIRANALSLADGTMNVLAVEGEIDFDITGETAPVYTFAPSLYRKEWDDGSYWFKSWRIRPRGDYSPYPENIAPNGKHRPLTWHPTFPGGLNGKGGLTSGSGIKPYIFASANTGIVAARKTTLYEGLWTDCDTIYMLDQYQLRHWEKENSDTLEGCTRYDVQYKVAKAETKTRRILLSPSQGVNILVGSTVIVGNAGSNSSKDRGQAYMRNIADCVRVLSVSDVSVGGSSYKAVELDVPAPMTIPETAYISSMPWNSGATESVKGHHDGSPVSNTSGKYPCRVAGIEMMNGAYVLGLDPLYQVTNTEDGGKLYTSASCRDSEHQSGSITGHYTSDPAATATFTAAQAGKWHYIKSHTDTGEVLLPAEVGGSETTYSKSAFSIATGAGVYSPWRFGLLSLNGYAGFACEHGWAYPSVANWFSSPRLAGAGKKRGELA